MNMSDVKMTCNMKVFIHQIYEIRRNEPELYFGALFEKPGSETLYILITLADDPLFAHMSDRLRLMARERAAKDSELSAFSFTDYKKWKEEYEAPPRNRNELLKIVLNRLEDINHDIHHDDFSDRSALKSKDQEAYATIVSEKIF